MRSSANIIDRSNGLYAPINLSEHIKAKTEGYIICEAVPIMRDGSMIYGPGEMPGEKSWTEVTRAVEDIFRPETISSFEGQPVTINHPPDFVNPDNWEKETVGICYNVRRGTGSDANKLVADLIIFARRAIDAILSKKLREVSSGYYFNYHSNGDGTGKLFDIMGNHVALVEAGRCGAECAIFDSASNNKQSLGKKSSSRTKETTMSWKNKIMAAFGAALDEAGIPDETPQPAPRARDCGGNHGASADVVALTKSVGDIKTAVDALLARAKTEDDAKAAADKKATEDAAAAKAAADAAAAAAASAAKDEPDSETMARAEVLSPGIAKSGDVRAKALEACYGTTEGKAIIDSLLGGRPFDEAAKSDVTLFNGAVDVMKATRMATLNPGISADNFPGFGKGVMTPEKINDHHAKHYGLPQ